MNSWPLLGLNGYVVVAEDSGLSSALGANLFSFMTIPTIKNLNDLKDYFFFADFKKHYVSQIVRTDYKTAQALLQDNVSITKDGRVLHFEISDIGLRVYQVTLAEESCRNTYLRPRK